MEELMLNKINELVQPLRHTKYMSFPDNEDEIETSIANLISEIKNEIAENDERLEKLSALENAGVDNWSGYSYAMELLEEIDNES